MPIKAADADAIGGHAGWIRAIVAAIANRGPHVILIPDVAALKCVPTVTRFVLVLPPCWNPIDSFSLCYRYPPLLPFHLNHGNGF